MNSSLGHVARIIDAAPPADAPISGWSIDSRTVAEGDLFFALRGPNHDGHAYVQEVITKIAAPQIAVVTNVGYAHIENFDSIEGIALAKRELVEALPTTGVAVLNADDHRVARFHEIHPGKTITFGIANDADIRAEDVKY